MGPRPSSKALPLESVLFPSPGSIFTRKRQGIFIYGNRYPVALFTQLLCGSEYPSQWRAMTERSDSSAKEAKPKAVKPPIKLCFKQKVDLGRSNLVPFRPRTYVHYVTRKFYAPDYSIKCYEEEYQKVKKEYEDNPKKKYGYPVLESHRWFTLQFRYGWYSDVKFHDPDKIRDRRLHFPKRRNPLFTQPFLKPML